MEPPRIPATTKLIYCVRNAPLCWFFVHEMASLLGVSLSRPTDTLYTKFVQC